MSDARPKGPALGDVVSAAGFALGLLTTWLYVAGWTYAYHYFDRLRIPLLMTDLPHQHYVVYGGLVVWKNLVGAALAALVVLCVAAAGVRFGASLDRLGVSAALVKSDCGRLVLFSNQRLFLIRPVRGAPGLDLDTFVLPWSELAALRVTSEYASCP